MGSTPEERLAEIARLLNTPVEVFTGGAQDPHDLDARRKLLEIWDELPSPGDRQQLLAFARALLARC